MKTLITIVAAILFCLPAVAQNSDLAFSAGLTAASSDCSVAGSCLTVSSKNFRVAGVSVRGTYSGSTLVFEYSDDGLSTWFSNTCARGDAAILESSEALPTNQSRSWDCGVYSTNNFRIRQSAISTGSANVVITLSQADIEPAATVAIATGGNPCVNPGSTLQSVSFTTAGTAAVQEVALVSGQKIFICSLTVIGQSGTTPTFSLVSGTGSNCAAGQAVVVPAFATPANTLFQFANPVGVTTAGQELCYLDTGTTPIQVAAITFVQQ